MSSLSTRDNVKTFKLPSGYLPVLPPNLGCKTGKYPGKFRKGVFGNLLKGLFTWRFFLRYPCFQICEIRRNFEKIQTKIGNNPFGKKVNTPPPQK